MKKEHTHQEISITVGDTSITASIRNSNTAKDFLSLLPLTITLTDYAGTEKVSELPKRLDISDAPAGYKPSIGDITYYAPWGNLAIFYKGFDYAGGLVPLGKIENGMEALKKAGKSEIKMELMHKS